MHVRGNGGLWHSTNQAKKGRRSLNVRVVKNIKDHHNQDIYYISEITEGHKVL